MQKDHQLQKIVVEISEHEREELMETTGLSKCTKARFSKFFISLMTAMHKARYIDAFSMANEILFLEGIKTQSQTKKAEKFTGNKMDRFWHKHWFEARHMPRNLTQHFSKGDVSKPNSDFSKTTRVINRIVNPYIGKVAEKPLIEQIAHRFSIQAYEERAKAKKLTGDWIVFAKYKKTNHYLFLTHHLDNTNGMYEFIEKNCSFEFPYLFND